MAQTLYWTVYLDSVADYANNTTDAAKIKNGQDSTGASLPAGQKGSQTYTSGSPVDASTPASGLTAGTAYRTAWTIYDDVALTYGGGTGATYVVFSDPAFTTFVAHSTTGALTAQEAVVAGSATHPHTTTGSLTAQEAIVAGAAQHPHTTTGAISAQSATVAGTAVHLTLHTTTGALSADVATVAGAADHSTAGGTHPTTGALSADAATVAGTAAHLTLHTSTGTLSADGATVAGTAAHFTLHATTGALAADSATVAGESARPSLHETTGALAADAATISGNAQNGVVDAGVTPSGGWDTETQARRRKLDQWQLGQRKRRNVSEELDAILRGDTPSETPEATQARIETEAARVQQQIAARREERRSQQVTAEIKALLDENLGLQTAIAQAESDDEEAALMMLLALA
jgi:hypothetical protein